MQKHFWAWLMLIVWIAVISGVSYGQDGPQPGSPGLDDPLFPLLGNGGYDVQHYALDLTWEPDARRLTSTATIEAIATQDLSAFNFDFAGYGITSVSVNDTLAAFTRVDQELTITPMAYLPEGDPFAVEVTYSGTPQPVFDRGAPVPVGWIPVDDQVVYAVDADAGWYPANDLDRDKATFTIRVTVPKPLVVVATGVWQDTIDNGDTLTYVWNQAQPVSGMTLLIDEFATHTIAAPDGGPTITVYYPAGNSLAEYSATHIDFVPDILRFYVERYGAFPYDSLSIVATTGLSGVAYSFTTVMAFPYNALTDDSLMAHELAHLWFGNSVSLYTTLDNWLSEGFATYLAGEWTQYATTSPTFRLDISYDESRTLIPPGSPTVDTLYDWGIYFRGGWTLYALRLTVGDDIFLEIMRTYYDRYRYSVATTADFVAVAEEVSGQDLAAFFDAWLYAEVMPPLPEPKN